MDEPARMFSLLFWDSGRLPCFFKNSLMLHALCSAVLIGLIRGQL